LKAAGRGGKLSDRLLIALQCVRPNKIFWGCGDGRRKTKEKIAEGRKTINRSENQRSVTVAGKERTEIIVVCFFCMCS
jgi:hypothetical protein